ncbi:hypothetical protein EDEG_02513 [Edhazardia aedis USNM 41457]|uniref:dolichyl-phosphate-mannose--protein mannosyltransferase n=1 Tax=Edhazardia aedis (strain USNM 41457) TaxID=1003232 RepID=J9DKJ3_EDHAE|nr:hypothetical protein EDEG_02513 [Edhazardia aedis USNM 41457]|eukprot:EJW03105.1 hypothetical protein EDEG_02513 [Edhazardia aedis USNM 41457]
MKLTVEMNRRSQQRMCILSFTILLTLYNVFWPRVFIKDEEETIEIVQKYISNLFTFSKDPPFAVLLITGIFQILSKINNLTIFRIFSINTINNSSINNMTFYVYIFRFIHYCMYICIVNLTYTILCKVIGDEKAFITTFMFVFEVSFNVVSKIVTAEAYYLFFTTLYIYTMSQYIENKKYTFLYINGLIFGALISTKRLAILHIIPFLLYNIVDSYKILINTNVKLFYGKYSATKQIFHKFVSLSFVPFSVYIASFYMYFFMLNIYTDDSLRFSLNFQSTLDNNYLELSDKYLVDRSLVTLISRDHKVYLKSDPTKFASESKQQKAFGDSIKDENAIWMLVKMHIEGGTEKVDEKNKFFIKNGDYVKFVHSNTDKYLHSHDISQKNTDKKFKELTCFGKPSENITDDNDLWIIKSSTEYVINRESEIVLQHAKLGNFLGLKSKASTQEDEINEGYTSTDASHSHRVFYFEDNRIDPYYAKNLESDKAREKISHYKKLSFWNMFCEYCSEMWSDKVYEHSESKKNTISPYMFPFNNFIQILYNETVIKNESNTNKINSDADADDNNTYSNKIYTINTGNSNTTENTNEIVMFDSKKQELKLTHKTLKLSFNKINTTLCLITLLLPLILLTNNLLKTRFNKFFTVHPVIYVIYGLFLTHYIPLLLKNEKIVLSACVVPFYCSLLVSLYFVSKFSDKALLCLVMVSSAVFCRSIGLSNK